MWNKLKCIIAGPADSQEKENSVEDSIERDDDSDSEESDLRSHASDSSEQSEDQEENDSSEDASDESEKGLEDSLSDDESMEPEIPTAPAMPRLMSVELLAAAPAAEVEVDEFPKFEAVLYKIEGQRCEMVHPRTQVHMTTSEVQIVDDNGLIEETYPISKICAVRQHRPTTCQFLVRAYANRDPVEYGFHFNRTVDGCKFRVILQETIFDTLDLLMTLKVDVEIYDTAQKMWRMWAVGQTFMIGRREEDGLGMVCVATPTNDTRFLCELSNEFQYWVTEDPRVFTIWGPYLTQDVSSGDLQPTKYMIRFRIDSAAQEDSVEVLKIFEKLVGYEDKVVHLEEALGCYETQGNDKMVDDVDIMWDEDEEDISDRENEEVKQREEDYLRELENAEYADEATDLKLPEPPAYDESPVKRRRNRTSISYDPSDNIIEKDPDAKLHRFMQCGQGRSFVCRANQAATSPLHFKDPSKRTNFDLNVYANNERGLSEVTTIQGDRFRYNKEQVVPVDGLLHGGESKLLMRADHDPNAVYYMDLERETVVSKFEADKLPMDMIFNAYKGSNTTGEPTFMAANSRAFFSMDTRAQKARGHTLEYKTNPGFTAAGTDEAGHILLANRRGQLRLYDGEPNAKHDYKIAKTQLDAIPEPIKAVDVTSDGSWICATMRTCLVVYPTKLRSTGKTGFESRLGKNKPPAIYLRLKQEDVMKYGLTDIDFQPAVFDPNHTGIFTSTGNLAIVWDFKSVRRGKFDHYSIKITPSYIKDSRALNDGSVVVAYPQGVDVLGQKTVKRR